MGIEHLEELRSRAQAFSEDTAREGYLAASGLKNDAELQAIYARYGDILDRDTLLGCIERFQSAPNGSEEQRAARLMLDWQIDAQTGRQLAELDEREITLENTLMITLPDHRVIGYQEAMIEIVNSTDRARRKELDDARAVVVQDTLAPIRLERLQRERDYVESLGIAPTYNATFEAMSQIDLITLVDECTNFLSATQSMWDDVRADLLRNAGIPLNEATRADVLALFRLREYDDAFSAREMVSAIQRNCREMGIDPTANGQISFDLDDRPGKRSRAFCSPVQIPSEVYLVMRPHGGQSDYNTFLHELGHALHFGYARADYPFEYRWLGDNSVTESYAMLFDHRMADREWLLRYTDIGNRRVEAFLRINAVEELQMLRRYCSKLLYEVQVYGGDVSWDELPDLYVQTLTDGTGFRYQAADAFVDLDTHYYATRYLRAWQLQAVLNDTLTRHFNEDWWRNPAAGPWIIEQLFAEGQRENANEVAERVAGSGLSFGPFIRGLEAILA